MHIDGLPNSKDPYKGSSRQGPTKPPSQTPPPMNNGMGGMGGMNSPMATMPTESAGPTWTPFKIADKRDMVFKRNDGFYLRSRPFQSVSNKWMAQLFRDDKIIDKGQVLMPENVDPAKFLQKIANYILDDGSYRYQQSGQPAPVSENKPTEEPLDPGSDFDIELQ